MAERRGAMEQQAVRDASPTYSLEPDIETTEDVPPGYKRTEVGVIPEDWVCIQLGDAIDLLTGFPFPSSGFSDDGALLVRGSNVKRGQLDWEDEITRRWKVATPAISRYELKEGDLVVAMDGALVGRSFAIISASDLPALLVQRVARIRSANVSQTFIIHWVASDYFAAYVDSVKTYTAIPHISPSDIRRFTISAPLQEAEQRAIATALSDADALIESLDRLIAKKRAIKQAAMQQLLTGQTRLPGFTGEWETKRLGEIAEIRSGGTPSTTMPAFWSGGVPWCTPTDITALRGRKYLSETERTISHAGLHASSAESIPPQSIIMTTRATIGECAINTVPMTTNQGFKNLVPLSVNTEFLYYLMTTKKSELIQLCGGSTFLEIGKKQLNGFELTLPPSREERGAIATVLSDMDTEIEALERRRDNARQIKQGMMQLLLTGRVRLFAD